MKSRARTQHLTDAEFSDMLTGDLPDEMTRMHLEICEHCRGELHSVSESLASFQSAASHWAEVAAPARISVPSRWSLGFAARPAWMTGLAATALTGVVMFLHTMPTADRMSSATQATPVAVAAPTPSTSELADDNRLMLSIDQELGYQAQTSGTLPADASSSHHGSRPVLN